MLNSLFQDLRFALRTCRRDLGFTVVAILILGLGIGANTAVFTVVDAILLRPLPFKDPDRLVWIYNLDRDQGLSATTTRLATFQGLLEVDQFEEISAFDAFFGRGSYTLTGNGQPQRLVGVEVAQNLFGMLGLQTAMGRVFSQQECLPNGPRAVILSHRLWAGQFGADPDILGTSIQLNEAPYEVVGVMPADFDFGSVFSPGVEIDLFTPLVFEELRPRGNMLAVIGKLKPEATMTAAASECKAVVERLYETDPDWGRGYKAQLMGLKEYISGSMRPALIALWCAVGFVLLIVCTNLSNLQMGRAAARSKEIAVRCALGAGKLRLVRQLLTESLFISTLGALAGLGVAIAAVRYLTGWQSLSIPMMKQLSIDTTALAYTIGATVLTGLLFGLAPALQASAGSLKESLNDGRGHSSAFRRHGWLRSFLVVAEIALACLLLVGSGLLMRSFMRLLDVDLGFQAQGLVSLRIDPGPSHSGESRLNAFLDAVLERARNMAGVEAAAVTDALPLDRNRSWGIRAKGQEYQDGQYIGVFVRMISPEYARTMRIPLIAGREFDSRDSGDSEPVVIINQSAARRLWPDSDALGKIAQIAGQRRVVGIFSDVRHSSLEQDSGLEAYMPFKQIGSSSLDLVVRSSLPAASVAAGLRSALRQVDSNLPLNDFRPLTLLIDRSVSPRRFFMTMIGAFAALALILASLGIYGVVSHSVTQRTSEIGIRMALGASAGRVRMAVLSQTMRLVVVGVFAGTLGALALARLMAALLFQISPTDAATFGAVIALLSAVALAAGYIPARRASRIEPLTALRSH